MTVAEFLLPVFVEVLLIFVVMILMMRARVGSVLRGQVKPRDIALSGAAYDDRTRQYSNCFINQFELPSLFFALIAFILITRVGDVLLLGLAWIFVLSRIVHAFVHTTSNNLNHRFGAYTVGAVALFAMWLVFAIKILSGA